MTAWTWLPTHSVGPFFFGQPMPVLRHCEITLLPPACEGADWQTYRIGDEEARVAVREDLIVSVECDLSLILKGQELLGVTVAEANEILPEPAILARDYGDGNEMWENDALGLTLWVEDGVVDSATVGAAQ